MPNRKPDEEILAAALTGSADCPPVEELERLLVEEAPISLKQHAEACAHCRTELALLRSFESNRVSAEEKASVDLITARLKQRSGEIIAPRAAVEEHQPWWKEAFTMRWMTPAAAALAIVLVGAGVVLEMRQNRQPALTGTGGTEILRSPTIAILSPVGDLHEKPAEIRWEAAQRAVRYRVRILGVDRQELWSGETASNNIALPPNAKALIVPMKTLLIQVGAYDEGASKIAESEAIRFRLLQSLYTH